MRSTVPGQESLERIMGEKITSIDPLQLTTGGSHSHVFVIHTPLSEYILRIPRGAQGFCTRFVESHIDRCKWLDQRWSTDQVRKLGVPAPHILHSSREEPLDSVSYVIMNRLPGKPIDDYEKWDGCPYDEKDFGTILGKIHTIKIAGAGPIDDFGRTYFNHWHEFLLSMATKLMQMCTSRNAVSGYLCDKLNESWLPKLVKLDNVDCRLLHLESLGFANILYNPESKRITGFLDYEDCIGGDPLFELAWMYYYYGRPSSQRYFNYDRFFAGYGSQPHFIERIDVYLPFMWLDKLSWIQTDSARADGYRARLEETCRHGA